MSCGCRSTPEEAQAAGCTLPAGEMPARAEARTLAAAESECCSFFTFELQRRDAELRWSVEVPPGREDTLALLDRLVAGV